MLKNINQEIMKKLLLILLALNLSCKSDINSNASGDSSGSIQKSLGKKIEITDQLEKYFLQDGIEQRNKELEDILSKADSNTSNALEDALNRKSRYSYRYDSVENEKNIIEAKSNREVFVTMQKNIQSYLSSPESEKAFVYPLQKSPKDVVLYLFKAVTSGEFSNLKYFNDPYLKDYSDAHTMFLMAAYLPEMNLISNKKAHRKFTELLAESENISIEVQNVRIEKNKAFVLTSLIDSTSTKGSKEFVIELVNRNEYWFFDGIRD